MSCTSPFTVARRILPRPSSSLFSMKGSRIATACFITSALCSTNGNCISPLPKSSPTVFIPVSRWSLIIPRGLRPTLKASCRSPSSPTFSPSIIRRSKRSVRGSAASSAAREIFVDLASTPSKSSKKTVSGSYVHSPSSP